MESSLEQPSSLDYPELIVGIAGPIGVDMDLIAASLGVALGNVGYASTLIKLTAEMARFPINDPELAKEPTEFPGTEVVPLFETAG